MAWFLAIMLRIAVFRKTKLRDFGWYLAFCIIAEISLFAMNWFRWPSGHVYDLTWRVTQCISLLGLAAVTWEAVGSSAGTNPAKRHHINDLDRRWWQHGNKQCPSSALPLSERHGSSSPGIGASHREHMRRTMLVPLILTPIVIMAVRHTRRWPEFWLEPIFTAICAANLFFGMVIISARRWTSHSAILCEWLMFNGVLYSGAAISPREVGLAGEILNCITFAAWSFI